MHDMSFAEGIATAVVNPRIRVSVQLTNLLICFAKHALLVDHMTMATVLQLHVFGFVNKCADTCADQPASGCMICVNPI